MKSIGMKTIIAAIIECVGPRCSRNGISISMSGMTESVITRGMFSFVFVACAVNLQSIYPNAKCPTANDFFSSLFHLKAK
jgi:hypothetical protein